MSQFLTSSVHRYAVAFTLTHRPASCAVPLLPTGFWRSCGFDAPVTCLTSYRLLVLAFNCMYMLYLHKHSTSFPDYLSYDVITSLLAAEEDRVWVKRRIDGELDEPDDNYLAEGLTGKLAA